MIIFDLFKHESQKTFRSSGYHKNLLMTVLMALAGLYIVAVLMFLGSTFPRIVADVVPQFTPMEFFSGSLLYIMLLSLAVRYFMQSLGTINVQLYQALPIKRSVLVNFIVLKPLLSPVNYMTLAFVLPFAVRYVSRQPDAVSGFLFIVTIVFLIWFNVWVASVLKRKISASIWGTVGVILFFGAVAALEYFEIFSSFAVSKTIFGFVFSNPIGVVIAFLLALSAYFLNLLYFRKNFYPESFNKNLAKNQVYSTQLSFMDRFGKIGELMRLHVVTFMRNKRMKSTVYLLPIFLLYGLLFYSNPAYGSGMLIFIGIFITGIFMLILGQWAIALNSTCFDAIMSKMVTSREYILSYYYLMVFFCVASFILTTPYFLYGTEIVIVQTVAFLYNIGVSIFILLYFNMYNNSRLELNVGGAFNFQGVSMKNFLVLIPILALPMIIMTIATALGNQNVGFLIIGLLGLLGVIFTKPLLSLCEKQFLRKKYYLCEGFRKKGE